MSNDTFNLSMRKFLKTVGVTSQQQIEDALRTAREAGTLPAGPLPVEMVLTIPALGLTHRVAGEIKTEGEA